MASERTTQETLRLLKQVKILWNEDLEDDSENILDKYGLLQFHIPQQYTYPLSCYSNQIHNKAVFHVTLNYVMYPFVAQVPHTVNILVRIRLLPISHSLNVIMLITTSILEHSWISWPLKLLTPEICNFNCFCCCY